MLVGVSAFPYIGFSNIADQTGANSYTGDFGSGKVYVPQYFLQGYSPFIDTKEIGDASVNESATGQIEVISYGLKEFMNCNIRFANNSIYTCDKLFDYNATGYDDLRDFMLWCINKKPIEFMPDISDANIFDNCIYDSGTKYNLKEQIKDGLKNYYETGTIKFRKV